MAKIYIRLHNTYSVLSSRRFAIDYCSDNATGNFKDSLIFNEDDFLKANFIVYELNKLMWINFKLGHIFDIEHVTPELIQTLTEKFENVR